MVILYSYRVKNNAYEMKFIQYMCSECIWHSLDQKEVLTGRRVRTKTS